MVIDVECPHNPIHTGDLHEITVRLDWHQRGAPGELIGDACAYQNITVFSDHPHAVLVDGQVVNVLLEWFPLAP